MKQNINAFVENQSCRKVFNSLRQRLCHEKKYPNPKKEMTEAFRTVSITTNMNAKNVANK